MMCPTVAMRASDAHVSRDPAWHDATCHICPRGKGDHLPHVPISAVPLSHPTARHLSLHAPHLPERKTKASTRITHKPLALSRRVPPVCHVGIAGEAAGDDGGGGRGRRGGGRGRVVVRATDDDGARRGAAAMASSCWGRLGLAALWHRLRQLSVARRRRRHGGGGGGAPSSAPGAQLRPAQLRAELRRRLPRAGLHGHRQVRATAQRRLAEAPARSAGGGLGMTSRGMWYLILLTWFVFAIAVALFAQW